MMQARTLLRTAVVLALSSGFLSAGASASVDREQRRIIPPPHPAEGIIILAQEPGPSPGPGPGMTTPESNGGGLVPGLSSSVTTEIIRSLGAGESLCGEVRLEYRLDCLVHTFRLTARLARERPGYGVAASELETAAQEISRVVSRNADPAAERLRHRGRVYRAVRPETVSAAAAEVDAILTETETRLLRSAGSAGQAHYQRIAQAVGSTKRILRS